MTGFGLDPDWLTEQLRSCSAIQKPIFKYVAKIDTFLPVAFADGLEVGGTVGLPVPVGGCGGWVGGVGWGVWGGGVGGVGAWVGGAMRKKDNPLSLMLSKGNLENQTTQSSPKVFWLSQTGLDRWIRYVAENLS